MSFFTFPRQIYFQRDIIDSLSDIVCYSKYLLVVTDSNIKKIHGERIKKSLSGINYKIFSDVLPEPSIESIENAFLNYKNEVPDTIIAIGGGSVMDFAKSMAIKFSYPDLDLRNLNPFEKIKIKLNLIAIPTTSGTGSDVSFGIVLTDGNRKLALGNYGLVPMISILDSSLTPVNKNIIRITGVDAFVHAFEALSANTSNIFTDALAEKSIETIYNNLKLAMENDDSAKDLVHLSATMAGLAFSNSGTALTHALGHSFGATFHVVHGISVGIFLPYVIDFNSQDENTNAKYKKIGKILGFKNLVNGIKKFYQDIGQPYFVKQLNIEKEYYLSKIDEAVEKAMMDSELAFNPVIAGEEDIKRIYLKAYGD
ncbi:MAG: iron-containing alcohol dehydrogenase [Thermoplasmata archaeon]